jgi:DNA-binding transcriptional regulator YdaS (Cro superfamily)
MDSGIEKAVKAAGTIAALARKLGITRAAIHQWPRVPPNRVIQIEQSTGIPREELRPDLYPPQEKDGRVPEREGTPS